MLKMIHSYWAYFALIILTLATFNAIIGYVLKKEFKEKDLRISLFAFIAIHIQLLIGLGWYFMSPWYKSLKEIGVANSNRMLAVEHPIIILIGIATLTVGWLKHKKKTSDEEKFKTIALFYSFALALILTRIPWDQWPN